MHGSIQVPPGKKSDTVTELLDTRSAVKYSSTETFNWSKMKTLIFFYEALFMLLHTKWVGNGILFTLFYLEVSGQWLYQRGCEKKI